MKYDKETIGKALAVIMPKLPPEAIDEIALRLMGHLSEYYRYLLLEGESKEVSDKILEISNRVSPESQAKLASIMTDMFNALPNDKKSEIVLKMDQELAQKGHELLISYGNGE